MNVYSMTNVKYACANQRKRKHKHKYKQNHTIVIVDFISMKKMQMNVWFKFSYVFSLTPTV